MAAVMSEGQTWEESQRGTGTTTMGSHSLGMQAHLCADVNTPLSGILMTGQHWGPCSCFASLFFLYPFYMTFGVTSCGLLTTFSSASSESFVCHSPELSRAGISGQLSPVSDGDTTSAVSLTWFRWVALCSLTGWFLFGIFGQKCPHPFQYQ